MTETIHKHEDKRDEMWKTLSPDNLPTKDRPEAFRLRGEIVAALSNRVDKCRSIIEGNRPVFVRVFGEDKVKEAIDIIESIEKTH